VKTSTCPLLIRTSNEGSRGSRVWYSVG
jgi:hypothetical protein